MELKDRFLKYVSFDTQSDESSETFPSTAKQRVLLDYLAEEMKTLGLTEVTVDKYGYAMGTIPATPGCEKAPVIGFIAHGRRAFSSLARHRIAIISDAGVISKPDSWVIPLVFGPSPVTI